MKKIAIDCRCFNCEGGTKTYVINLIKNLLLIDSENQYFLFYNSKKYLKTFSAPNLTEIAVECHYKFLYPIWDQIISPYLAKKYKIDIFHGPKNSIPFLGNFVKIQTILDLLPITQPKSVDFFDRQYFKFNLFISKLIKRKKVIFLSNSVKNQYFKLYSQEINFKVIPLGVSLLKLQILEGSDFYKEEDNIVYLGDLIKRKNIPRLLKAFCKVLEVIPDTKLYLIGKLEKHDKEIDILIKSLKLQNKVILTGYVSNHVKFKLFQKAQVFIYPSIEEGFGLPILEAMSYGVPVITSNCSSMEEIANHSAVLIDPYSVEEMTNAIKLLLTNKLLRKELINRGLENVKKYTWEYCAVKTLAFYNQE